MTTRPQPITLVTGGARSGKSFHAMQLALEHEKPVFLATAVAFDDEMRLRIARHQAERGNKFVLTVEEPYNPAQAILKMPEDSGVILLDCITVWLGNLLCRDEKKDRFPEIEDFITCLDRPRHPMIIVTNEVGMGLVPDNPLGRRFRDIAGEVNRRIAEKAAKVVFTVCGIPFNIKNG